MYRILLVGKLNSNSRLLQTEIVTRVASSLASLWHYVFTLVAARSTRRVGALQRWKLDGTPQKFN